MPEQYADFSAATTVATGGYTAGAGALNVASTGAPFPSTGTFSVVILDGSTGATKVLLRVTAKNSTTQWAVTAEGTDANAVAGDNVYAVLSVSGLDQIRSDMSQRGAYGSLPASSKNGNVYRSSDGPYVLRDNGATFDANHSPAVVIPGPVSNWTWVNQTSNAVTANAYDASGVVAMNIPDCATLNWRLLTQTPPGQPYSAIAWMKAAMFWKNSQLMGLYFYDGTKLMGIELLSQSNGATPAVPQQYIRVEKITNVGADSSTAMVLGESGGSQVTSRTIAISANAGVWFKIRRDSTSLYFDWSLDGVKFYNLFSETTGTFITPTKVGFGGVSVCSVSTLFVNISLLSFAIPANATL